MIPDEYLSAMADLANHHITGIAVMGDTPFDCPLVSHVEGNLWQGGTPADAGGVPAFFQYVLNLYPWVPYQVPEGTTVLRQELYDSGAGVPSDVIDRLADWVNEKRALGPTLVHCQAGLNRSALVAAYALMKAGRTADEAITLLRTQRSPAVLCNFTFESWLRAQP